jgi:hypothetical protein
VLLVNFAKLALFRHVLFELKVEVELGKRNTHKKPKLRLRCRGWSAPKDGLSFYESR